MNIIHLLHPQLRFLAKVDVKQDLLRILHIVVAQQRRVKRVLHSLADTALTLAITITHQGDTAIFHGRIDIGEIQVDDTGQGDDLGDALRGYGQRIIRLAERVHDGQVRINLTQPLIVDHQKSVNILGDLLNAIQGLYDLPLALEQEWDRHDSHGQDAHIFRDTSDDRSGTRSGSSTHTSGDKNHLRAVVKHITQIVNAFLGRHHSPLGLVSRSQALRDLPSQQQLHRDIRTIQGLIVRITQHESNILDPFLEHVRDSVATSAANPDHLNNLRGFCRAVEI